MMNFREQRLKDLDEVFFNLSAFEFAATHSIAGINGGKFSPSKECNVVVDHELYVERRISSKAENVSLDGLLFFIKKSEWMEKFNNIPAVKEALKFDGRRYLVDSVRDTMGVLEITLEAYRGRA